jgi:hypothetical protein
VDAVKYWPFDVLPPDKRTVHHYEVIAFLEEAFHKGYGPYMFDGSNYGACDHNMRSGEIIHRGANRYWEIMLNMSDEPTTSFYVDGFLTAGKCVLQWLRGEDAAAIQSQFRDSIVSKPGVRGW